MVRKTLEAHIRPSGAKRPLKRLHEFSLADQVPPRTSRRLRGLRPEVEEHKSSPLVEEQYEVYPWQHHVASSPPSIPSEPADPSEVDFHLDMPDATSAEKERRGSSHGRKSSASAKSRIDWLRTYNAQCQYPTRDFKIEELLKKIIPPGGFFNSPEIKMTSMNELCQMMDTFSSAFRSRRKYGDHAELYQEFSERINTWESENGLSATSAGRFQRDVHLCSEPMSNEYMLQHTVMMNIADYWNLDKALTFFCEGYWGFLHGNSFAFKEPSKPSAASEASEASDNVGGLRPDLAVFFTGNAITGEEDFNECKSPDDLRLYMCPDNSMNRCFPFLFIEAKKSGDSFDMAIAQAMKVTSQALWNIYKWMKKADCPEEVATEQKKASTQAGGAAPKTKKAKKRPDEKREDGIHMRNFWEKVRVFSFTVNSKHVNVRVHRAKRLDSSKKGVQTDGLAFLFDVIESDITLSKSNHHKLCALFRNIAYSYGVLELLPVLKKAVDAVQEHCKNRRYVPEPMLKRKQSTGSMRELPNGGDRGRGPR
jgi:hypothetical protein